MRYNLLTLLVIGVAGLGLAACEKKATDAQADAVRDTSQAAATNMENTADAVEEKGEAMGAATQNNAEASADAMRERAEGVEERGERQADAIEDGTTGATTRTDTMTTTTAPAKN
ncbi:MAG: hypothetical protein ACRC1J_06375 [Sandaracinobacteroides sp.]